MFTEEQLDTIRDFKKFAPKFLIIRTKSGQPKPFAFNIFEAGAHFMAQGRYEYEQLLMLYAFCMEEDKWPGYQVFTENKYGVNELNLPSYMMREINWFNHKF